MSKREDNIITTIADPYLDLTAEAQHDADEDLRRYLSVIRRIYEHLAANDPKILTELRKRARLRKNPKKALI